MSDPKPKSLTLTSKDLKRKRAFKVPEEPYDPIEDSDKIEPLIPVDDEVPTLEDLADLIEINDLEGVGQKLEALKATIEKMKDNKTRPVWASLHKVWYTLGHLKNEMNNVRTTNYEQDKISGMCRRLYAWMKHVEKVEPKLGLPEANSFFKKYK